MIKKAILPVDRPRLEPGCVESVSFINTILAYENYNKKKLEPNKGVIDHTL